MKEDSGFVCFILGLSVILVALFLLILYNSDKVDLLADALGYKYEEEHTIKPRYIKESKEENNFVVPVNINPDALMTVDDTHVITFEEPKLLTFESETDTHCKVNKKGNIKCENVK